MREIGRDRLAVTDDVCLVLAVVAMVMGRRQTQYHIVLPLVALWFLWRRFRAKRADFPLTRLLLLFLGMMGFWLAWGVAAVFISPYSETYRGLVNMGEVFLGACGVYCVYEGCGSRRAVAILLETLRLSCGVLLLYSLFESITGAHLGVSILVVSGEGAGSGLLPGLRMPELFRSSALSHNENNFCAQIAILLPTMFPTAGTARWRNGLRYAGIVLAFLIMSVDDGIISILAALLGVLVWSLLRRNDRRHTLPLAGASVAMQLGLAQLLEGLLLRLKVACLKRFAAAPAAARAVGAVPRVLRRRLTVAADANSTVERILADVVTDSAMRSRVRICLDDLSIAWQTRGLGCGPAGTKRFFETHVMRTTKTSPHCWWLEVLSQYGLPVFLAFVGMLTLLYARLLRTYFKTRESALAVLLAMGAAYVLASMAPSGFIDAVYQWIIPGLALALLRLYGEPEKGKEGCKA